MSEPKRDHMRRYILTDPNDPEKELHWTRATTWAESVEDQFGITKWKQRAVAVGLGLRPDLLGLAQALDLNEDKKELDGVCYKAVNAAKADQRSNIGTTLHKFTQRIDQGERPRIPAAYADEIDAYRELKRINGIETNPSYVERIVVVPEFTVAGTFDRLVRWDGDVVVGDLKTGDDIERGIGKIAIQLAIYANASHLWNAANGTYSTMPSVNRNYGLVIHVPAGRPLDSHLYKVDIRAGWEGAQLCGQVRAWRKRKDLVEVVG